MGKPVQLSVLVPEYLRERAKAAAQQGYTLSESLREALEETIERLEDAEIGPRAQAAYEKWVQDPSSARSWEEFESELWR